MHPAGANIDRERWISCDEQRQTARAADLKKPPRYAFAIVGAEMAIHNGGAARQPPRNRRRIGRPFRIGEKEEGRNGRRARIVIETTRQAR
jgi:hypothetical protein